MGPKRNTGTLDEFVGKKAKVVGHGLTWGWAGPADKKGLRAVLQLTSNSMPGCTKIAGFDIDSTIIKTKSGKKFATGATDWTWWHASVPKKLAELNDNGYRVIFFTNQAGIEKGKVPPEQFKSKLDDIVSKLEIPVFVFAATGENHYRKPSTTMWDEMESHSNKGVKVDRSKSVYVGDAAGRAKNWAPNQPKDFSCSDRMFGVNLGVKFQTPEEFFLGEKPAKFEWRSVDPSKFQDNSSQKRKDYHSKSGKEMVLMVGFPATGKSTFCKRYMEPHGYITINRDTLKTPAKCMKVAGESLSKGKSVVIDNTNGSPADRAQYIQIAKKAGAPVRCFVMKADEKLARHLNLVRQNMTNGEMRRVPDIGYNMYKSKYQAPSKQEGFSEICDIEFSADFDDNSHKKFFMQWTC